MTTFKVGDKAEITAPYSAMDNAKIGGVAIIQAICRGLDRHYEVDYDDNFGGRKIRGFTDGSNLKLIDPKPTKNQRITALEEKVKYLESVLDSLTHKKWTEDDLNELEAQVLTNNQKRKAIIEKAKKFVKDNLNNSSIKRNYFPADGIYKQKHRSEFVVNPEKRTVVFLIHNLNSKYTRRSIAKCHPNDVFNEHIGKAIAFGKKFGLDVSEFEQAVQPDEVVEGMDVRVIGNTLDTRIIANVAKVDINTNTLEYAQINGATILNDTDAVY